MHPVFSVIGDEKSVLCLIDMAPFICTLSARLCALSAIPDIQFLGFTAVQHCICEYGHKCIIAFLSGHWNTF